MHFGRYGLAAPGAQADDWQNDNNRNYDYSQPDDHRQAYPIHNLREGFHLSKIVNDRQTNNWIGFWQVWRLIA